MHFPTFLYARVTYSRAWPADTLRVSASGASRPRAMPVSINFSVYAYISKNLQVVSNTLKIRIINYNQLVCEATMCLNTVQFLEGESLSPVLTVPVWPRFTPVEDSRYTVINRDTFPQKINCVLTVPALTPVLPWFKRKLAPVEPRFTTE